MPRPRKNSPKKLTDKQKQFVKNYADEGNRLKAVKEAYNAKDTASASVIGNNLMKLPHVQQAVAAMRRKYLKEAPRAFDVVRELMNDQETPANVRLSSAQDIQDRAGLGAKTQEQKTDIYATGITIQWEPEDKAKAPPKDVIDVSPPNNNDEQVQLGEAKEPDKDQQPQGNKAVEIAP